MSNESEYRDLGFENPGYDTRECYRTRTVYLLYLTPEEISFGRRIVVATVLGGVIGWERRSADRPAGIRTMSLVSLGACLFSICSAFAFLDGPMNWDGSRVAAAIPSGVGFLGSAMIWKQVKEDNHSVHGLTTAASLWLSAAIGISCAGELYFAGSFSVAVMLILLRFTPKARESDEDSTSPLSVNDIGIDEMEEIGGKYGGVADESGLMRRGSEKFGNGDGKGHDHNYPAPPVLDVDIMSTGEQSELQPLSGSRDTFESLHQGEVMYPIGRSLAPIRLNSPLTRNRRKKAHSKRSLASLRD